MLTVKNGADENIISSKNSPLVVVCSEEYLDIKRELLKMEQMSTEEFLMCHYLLLLVPKVVLNYLNC